jgi:hypothetical protein
MSIKPTPSCCRYREVVSFIGRYERVSNALFRSHELITLSPVGGTPPDQFPSGKSGETMGGPHLTIPEHTSNHVPEAAAAKRFQRG